ncbi:hypothetical protein THAOC_21304, partial [Thalassiosira oceanica]
MNHPGDGNNPPGGDAAEDSLVSSGYARSSSMRPAPTSSNSNEVASSAAAPRSAPIPMTTTAFPPYTHQQLVHLQQLQLMTMMQQQQQQHRQQETILPFHPGRGLSSFQAEMTNPIMSSHVTDQFEEINRDAQNYTFAPIQVTPSGSARCVTKAWSVSRRENSSAKPRIVEEIDGTLRCGCLEDINRGMPCRHIQSITGGAFVAAQFHSHHHRIEEAEICPVAAPLDDECDFSGNSSS